MRIGSGWVRIADATIKMLSKKIKCQIDAHVILCYDVMICDSPLVNGKRIAIIAINNRNALQKKHTHTLNICVGWDNWLMASKNKTIYENKFTEEYIFSLSSLSRWFGSMFWSATHVKRIWALFTFNINKNRKNCFISFKLFRLMYFIMSQFPH